MVITYNVARCGKKRLYGLVFRCGFGYVSRKFALIYVGEMWYFSDGNLARSDPHEVNEFPIPHYQNPIPCATQLGLFPLHERVFCGHTSTHTDPIRNFFPMRYNKNTAK